MDAKTLAKYRKAAKLLEQARAILDSIAADESLIWAERNTAAHFARETSDVLTQDNHEAGLLPYIEKAEK